MKLYLAGPMRGYPEYNFPAFHAATKGLRERGHTVWSPAERDEQDDQFNPNKNGEHATGLKYYMQFDLPAVLAADAVAVLPGWEKSVGANLEVHVARTCAMPVYEVASLLAEDPFEITSGKRLLAEC